MQVLRISTIHFDCLRWLGRNAHLLDLKEAAQATVYRRDSSLACSTVSSDSFFELKLARVRRGMD
jgi:hypothetical protein